MESEQSAKTTPVNDLSKGITKFANEFYLVSLATEI